MLKISQKDEKNSYEKKLDNEINSNVLPIENVIKKTEEQGSLQTNVIDRNSPVKKIDPLLSPEGEWKQVSQK